MTLAPFILHVLDDVSPRMMPEPALLIHVQSLQAVTQTEIKAELEKLESKSWVVGIHDELEGIIRWKITTSGKAVLAEHR